MHDVLEQVDNFLNEPVEEDDKQEIFNRVSNFILQLEPDSLSDDQLDEVVEILDQLEFDEEMYRSLVVPKRICSNCGAPKPITEFSPKNFTKRPNERIKTDVWKNRYSYECKTCDNLKRKLRYQKQKLQKLQSNHGRPPAR